VDIGLVKSVAGKQRVLSGIALSKVAKARGRSGSAASPAGRLLEGEVAGAAARGTAAGDETAVETNEPKLPESILDRMTPLERRSQM
jgi:hypothetical protein